MTGSGLPMRMIFARLVMRARIAASTFITAAHAERVAVVLVEGEAVEAEVLGEDVLVEVLVVEGRTRDVVEVAVR